VTLLRTNIPPAELRSLRDDIRRFLSARFSGMSGWLCLGWIDGDPDIEPMREEWFNLPAQAHQVTARAVELAEQGYKLYVARCLLAEPRRSYPTALPSEWLWVDDAAIDRLRAEVATLQRQVAAERNPRRREDIADQVDDLSYRLGRHEASAELKQSFAQRAREDLRRLAGEMAPAVRLEA